MKFGIACFPSKEVQDFANSYRKRYDPHYSLIQPHLTIREAEEWSSGRLKEAVAHLELAVKTLSPFTVRFNRFSSLLPGSAVIYLALEDSEPFIRCHEALCAGPLTEASKSYRFHPHLTIGQQLGHDEANDILASLRKIPVSLSATIDRIHMLYQTENDAWTVHQTFLFGRT